MSIIEDEKGSLKGTNEVNLEIKEEGVLNNNDGLVLDENLLESEKLVNNEDLQNTEVEDEESKKRHDKDRECEDMMKKNECTACIYEEDESVEVSMDEISKESEKSEEIINEMEELINYELDKYRYQIEEDKIIYERNLLSYKDWELKSRDLVLKVKKYFNNIENIVNNFNNKMSNRLEDLSEDDRKLIENRIKGINVINKMSKNAMNNGINKLLEKKELDCNKMGIITNIEDKSKNEITIILNQNYSNLTYIDGEKLKKIGKYFSFIEGSLLPIIDGVESGINFVKNSTNEIIVSEILPVYQELKTCFDELFSNINIYKINLDSKSKINFSYAEVLDIEEVEDKKLDETIESIIREGYEYFQDIYGIGHNHIIRQAQIIAYKSIG